MESEYGRRRELWRRQGLILNQLSESIKGIIQNKPEDTIRNPKDIQDWKDHVARYLRELDDCIVEIEAFLTEYLNS